MTTRSEPLCLSFYHNQSTMSPNSPLIYNYFRSYCTISDVLFFFLLADSAVPLYSGPHLIKWWRG